MHAAPLANRPVGRQRNHRTGRKLLHEGLAAYGPLPHKLNQFALGNDTSNAPSGIGNPAGPTGFQETVFVSQHGSHYAGTFILDATNPDGSPSEHIGGVIKATRITITTPWGAFFRMSNHIAHKCPGGEGKGWKPGLRRIFFCSSKAHNS